MNKSQAKFILSSHRTDRPVPLDPALEEALRTMANDAELQEWFHRQHLWDEKIRSSLRTLKTPENLRSSILAGYHAGAPQPQARPRSFGLAIAACLAASFILWGGWTVLDRVRHPATFVGFRTDMSMFLKQGFTLDYVDDQLDQVTQWLGANKSLQGYTLPSTLSDIQSIGCRTLEWHGHRVALICFFLPDGKEVHLFAVNTTDYKDVGPQPTPMFSKEGIWNTASWKQGHWTYVLASQASEARLRELVQHQG
jgi:hypothetical protein